MATIPEPLWEITIVSSGTRLRSSIRTISDEIPPAVAGISSEEWEKLWYEDAESAAQALAKLLPLAGSGDIVQLDRCHYPQTLV
ncbi:MAG: hypothetical protein ACYS9X_14390 [Planctomycetota bacterium]|jgi:hypothetical protein